MTLIDFVCSSQINLILNKPITKKKMEVQKPQEEVTTPKEVSLVIATEDKVEEDGNKKKKVRFDEEAMASPEDKPKPKKIVKNKEYYANRLADGATTREELTEKLKKAVEDDKAILSLGIEFTPVLQDGWRSAYVNQSWGDMDEELKGVYVDAFLCCLGHPSITHPYSERDTMLMRAPPGMAIKHNCDTLKVYIEGEHDAFYDEETGKMLPLMVIRFAVNIYS
jgi:hypothetical protein